MLLLNIVTFVPEIGYISPTVLLLNIVTSVPKIGWLCGLLCPGDTSTVHGSGAEGCVQAVLG